MWQNDDVPSGGVIVWLFAVAVVCFAAFIVAIMRGCL
jgi:hypothetical protein